jgi:hypothetical protein
MRLVEAFDDSPLPALALTIGLGDAVGSAGVGKVDAHKVSEAFFHDFANLMCWTGSPTWYAWNGSM